jgi:hypothetical protein
MCIFKAEGIIPTAIMAARENLSRLSLLALRNLTRRFNSASAASGRRYFAKIDGANLLAGDGISAEPIFHTIDKPQERLVRNSLL